MEVHHHTRTERKKWHHYFWEFLMLFLAVFCGFLAENLREHQVETQRENQYAALLIEDIKADTSMLAALIEDIQFANPMIDSFQEMVNTRPLQTYPSGTWYYYGRWGTRVFIPVFQDATLEQLKSSGSLRYFKKQAVVDTIAHYDQACRHLLTITNLQQNTFNEVVLARNKIFNAYYMNEIMHRGVRQEKIDSFKREKIPFLSQSKEDFIQYASLCQLRSFNNKWILRLMTYTLDKARELLIILQREYHLK